MIGSIFGLVLTTLLWQKGCSEFTCPNSNGYYADPVQCDLYYECRNGEPKVKLCKDGLVFNDLNPLYERCDFPFAVDCKDRTYLRLCHLDGIVDRDRDCRIRQPGLECRRIFVNVYCLCEPAQASTNCPRRNGIFAKAGSCKTFWQCKDGLASKMNCQTGLSFNPKSGTCQWQYLVPDCGKEQKEQPESP